MYIIHVDSNVKRTHLHDRKDKQRVQGMFRPYEGFPLTCLLLPLLSIRLYWHFDLIIATSISKQLSPFFLFGNNKLSIKYKDMYNVNTNMYFSIIFILNSNSKIIKILKHYSKLDIHK